VQTHFQQMTTRMQQLRATRRAAAAIAVALGAAAATACNPDKVLEVTDPDIINPESVADSAGAEALRIGALARFNAATSGNNGSENLFILGGTLADEFRSSDTFVQRDETDQRNVVTSNANVNTAYRDAQRARLSAAQAFRGLAATAPSRRGQAAEMLYVQAYMENLLAETFCGAIPFSDFIGGAEVLGTPMSTTEALNRALAHADSALAFATGTDALSAQVRNATAVVKGRILLNLGRFADAATAVANVPTTFALLHEQSQSSRDNVIWAWVNNARRFTLVDREGGNGLNFISANDPRVPTAAPVRGGGFDSNVDLVRQNIYSTRETSFPIVTGIEARLIEAEAALQANNAALFLSKLNDPRSASRTIGAVTVTPAQLPALTDPGTAAGRQDLLFRERAFWLFGSGHRLGDLRRLVRQYQRNAESVYPTGIWETGAPFGRQVALPITQAEENNPNYNAAACVPTTA
jgi:starch-binding outer membrane protein, SusD/RagB family